MESKWWEKTVEYLAVLRLFGDGSGLMPLDGVHEGAGDLMIAQNYCFWLIEFKREEKDIKSEEKKFHGRFPCAKKQLEGRDGHHLLIYGDDPEKKLVLKCQTYFSGTPIDFGDMKKCSSNKKYFDWYLNRLLYWKNLSDGTGGNGVGPDYSNVCVVVHNQDADAAGVMSLSEYEGRYFDRENQPEPEPDQEPSPKGGPSGPSPGMGG